MKNPKFVDVDGITTRYFERNWRAVSAHLWGAF